MTIKEKKMQSAAILLVILLLTLSGVCVTGCGKAQKADQDLQKEATEEDIEEDTEKATEETAEKSADEIREQLTPSILQVTCGNQIGSGVIWQLTDDSVVILSAKHILNQAPTCDVTFYEGEYYQADVKYLSGSHDIGIAVIDKSVMDDADYQTLKAVKKDRTTASQLTSGEKLYVFGSADYIAGDFSVGELEQASVYQEDFQEEMLVGSGKVKEGMSGCGVFDQNGALLGVLTGGNDRQEFVAVPIWSVLADVKIWEQQLS